ncbi:MAG: TRIC cation channel family protein [Anaerolineae bacterium]|nr:TRIC cation channel family protein [Anaerolineae bacterium]
MENISSYFAYLATFLSVGSFVLIDLLAATTNALNGALLTQRPDYYKSKQWTVVGIIAMAIFGGIGGGVSRDILLNKIPGALTNPWYLIMCVLMGIVGLLISFKGGQKFRETFYQFMTAFSLPWYAIVGVSAALSAGLPDIAAIFVGVVGPTAGRFLIDVTAGKSAKQFVQSEWFVGTAVLTSVVYLIFDKYLGMGFYAATFSAFLIGFFFRVAAIWFCWEEPMPHIPPEVMGEVKPRITLKEKMKPGWEPEYD